MSKDGIYKASIGSDGKWHADGPGDPFSYYAGTLWPDSRFETKEDADKVCRLLDYAYRAGRQDQLQAVRKVLRL